MISNTLKAGDKVKVHFYDIHRNEEIKTDVFDKVFTVCERDGSLGIDMFYKNLGDNKFTAFHTFASSVNFENVETGQNYHYDTISGKVEKTGDEVKRKSVIQKLTDNKRILDEKAAEQKDAPQQEKSEKHHGNPER